MSPERLVLPEPDIKFFERNEPDLRGFELSEPGLEITGSCGGFTGSFGGGGKKDGDSWESQGVKPLSKVGNGFPKKDSDAGNVDNMAGKPLIGGGGG